MGLRILRRFGVLPGVTLNIGKRNASISLGERGAHFTIGTRGTTETVGLPGTGVYWTEHQGRGRRGQKAPGPFAPPPRISLGMFLLAVFALLCLLRLIAYALTGQ
jgi:hypothetical protein